MLKSFSGMTYQAAVPGQEPAWQRAGGVVRNGQHVVAEQLDQWIALECDGFSARGGEATFHLPGGDKVLVTLEVLDGFIHDLVGPGERSFTSEFALCRAKTEGVDHTGFGVYEVSVGVGAPRAPITRAFRAAIDTGLTHRDGDPAYVSLADGPGRDGWV
jgi:hypothetical protein